MTTRQMQKCMRLGMKVRLNATALRQWHFFDMPKNATWDITSLLPGSNCYSRWGIATLKGPSRYGRDTCSISVCFLEGVTP